jgi:hypothetical protein
MCRKILQHGIDGFTSPPKEVMLDTFITIKNPSSSAWFEPENHGCNGKHDSHKTTEGDNNHLWIVRQFLLE